MKISLEKFNNYFKNRLKSIFTADLSPKNIAINFTVGILIGLLIPMGLQTIAVITLCAMFRLNFFAVVFSSLITNPFSVGFIYYSAFLVGDFFLNSGISWNSINAVVNHPEFDSILNLSLQTIKVIYLGLLTESVILGFISFIIVYNVARYLKINNRPQSARILENK
jgi:uncharacterized protein (DUF2062 family)